MSNRSSLWGKRRKTVYDISKIRGMLNKLRKKRKQGRQNRRKARQK